MSASLPGFVGPYFHTCFMTYELLWNVLDAQRANATLSGSRLLAASRELAAQSRFGQHVAFRAFDGAGERILGAAMALTDEPLLVFDYTGPFPDHATCMLVGGFIAGPVGVAEAAAAVRRAGAKRVEAVILGGPTKTVAGVNRIHCFSQSQANVA